MMLSLPSTVPPVPQALYLGAPRLNNLFNLAAPASQSPASASIIVISCLLLLNTFPHGWPAQPTNSASSPFQSLLISNMYSTRQTTEDRGIATVERLVDNPGQTWTGLGQWWTPSGAINPPLLPFVPATPQHRLKEGKWTDWRHFTLVLSLCTAGK